MQARFDICSRDKRKRTIRLCSHDTTSEGYFVSAKFAVARMISE